MCEKLVPQKGTFFCADKVRFPLRRYLSILHILVVGFSPLPSATTSVYTSYLGGEFCAASPALWNNIGLFFKMRGRKVCIKKNNIIISPLGERRNFLANVMSLEISERGKINCLNYFIFRRLLELFKIFPLRDSTHLTSLVREEILFYS